MVAPIKVVIDGDTGPLNAALSDGSGAVKAFGHTVGVSIPTSKLDLAVTATKAIAKGTKSMASAAKDAAAEEKIFSDTMSKATGVSQDYNVALEDTINASQRKAFTDTETRKALASLTTATGDAASGASYLAVAQDVARVAGVDLEAASDAVAKAIAGQDTALLRMLPGLEKGATAQDTIANASKLAAGAADTYAQSSAAMGDKVKIAFGEITEAAGASLGPALKDLWAALKPLIIDFLELAGKVLPPVLDLFGRLISIASKVVTAINKIVDAVQRLIKKIKELLGPLTDAVNKLKNLDLNPFAQSAGVAGVAVSAGTFGAQPAGQVVGNGPVTINIYGDPAVIEAKVIRALRGYQARNGVGAVLTPGRR